MTIKMNDIVLSITLILTALSAGLFYAWVVSVIPGTRKISDQAYLEYMQSANKEILNIGFFLIFMGTLVLLLVNAFLQYKVGVGEVFYFSLGAMLTYFIGTMGVTFLGNIPLNNTLEAYDLSKMTASNFQKARQAFEGRWNMFNLMRTIAALISFILVLVALIKNYANK